MLTHTHYCAECKVLTVGDFYGPVIFFRLLNIYVYVCTEGPREKERKRDVLKSLRRVRKPVSDLSHGRDASRTDDWTGDCIKAIYNIMRDATPPPPSPPPKNYYCVGIQKTILYIIIF